MNEPPMKYLFHGYKFFVQSRGIAQRKDNLYTMILIGWSESGISYIIKHVKYMNNNFIIIDNQVKWYFSVAFSETECATVHTRRSCIIIWPGHASAKILSNLSKTNSVKNCHSCVQPEI